MHTEALNLHSVVVFLVAAGIIVPLLRRLSISPILGFLAVGVLIGPYGLARFSDDLPWIKHVVIADLEGVRAFAELGVVFLLFMIGLELSISRLWHMRRAVFGLGAAQVLLTGAVIAAIAGAFGNPTPAAIVLGAGFALSSTAIVTGLLIEGRRMATPTGQTCFAVLLFQDLAVLPMLFTVETFSAHQTESPWIGLATALGAAALAVAIILLAGRAVIRPLFRVIGRTASREMFLAAVLLVIIGTAIATEKAGLSMALGAFLAGLLFSETEYRHAVEADIEPFKGLLLGLFFVSVGMGIDPAEIGKNPVWLLAAVAGLFMVKGLIFYTLARFVGRNRSVAAESALLLGQGGEFAFLVVGLAMTLGLMPRDIGQFMLIVASLTMMLTPLIAILARRFAQRLETMEAATPTAKANIAEDLAGHIVIAGYGRVGHMLGDVLSTQEAPFVAIDIDPVSVSRYLREGGSIVFGDARQPSMLARVGADRARALVVTMDDPTAVERVVSSARRAWPGLPIYARARDGEHARRLFSQGATHTIPETIEASLQLSEMVLLGCGVPEEAARKIVQTRRHDEQCRLERARPGNGHD